MEQATQTNPYLTVFALNIPKHSQIMAALDTLTETLDRQTSPSMRAAWAMHLMAYRGEDLAHGFYTAALTCDGFPKLRDIIGPIDDRMYAADCAWLFPLLVIHGPTWRTIPEKRSLPRRDPANPTVNGEPNMIRDLLSPEIPAPPMPQRLEHACRLMGHGDHTAGLVALAAHPAAGASYEPAEAQRMRQQLDRDFRHAWQMARNEELAR